MSLRTWFYGRMTGFEPLTDLVGGAENPRIFAKKSMTSSVEQHPYIVYKLGYSTDEGLAETEEVNRQYVQVFVHDYQDGDTADYMRIDDVIKQLRLSLKLASDKAENIFSVRYLETSQDLNDETLNTVMKYVRFQIIAKEQ